MMRIRRSKRFFVLLGGVIVAGVVAAVALSAVTSQQVINDTSNVHLRIVRTTADGFDSGWHVHPGIVIVQVQEGSLQLYQGSCTPKTVGAGDTYLEVPHLAVRAVATGRVAWTTTMITNGADPVTIPLSAYNPQNPNPCP
jgi:hypothetical protein